MKVRATVSFVGRGFVYTEGDEFEIDPDAVDWLQAGLVEPVEPPAPKTATRKRAKRTTAKKGPKADK